MDERVEVVLPVEVLERIDRVVDLLGFESRERFVEASVLRVLDQYLLLLSSSTWNGRG